VCLEIRQGRLGAMESAMLVLELVPVPLLFLVSVLLSSLIPSSLLCAPFRPANRKVLGPWWVSPTEVGWKLQEGQGLSGGPGSCAGLG